MSTTPDYSDQFRVELVGPNNKAVADSDNIVGLDITPEHTAKYEMDVTISPDADIFERVFDDLEIYHDPPGGTDTLLARGPIKNIQQNQTEATVKIEAYGMGHHLDNGDAGLKTFEDTPHWIAASNVWSEMASDSTVEGSYTIQLRPPTLETVRDEELFDTTGSDTIDDVLPPGKFGDEEPLQYDAANDNVDLLQSLFLIESDIGGGTTGDSDYINGDATAFTGTGTIGPLTVDQPFPEYDIPADEWDIAIYLKDINDNWDGVFEVRLNDTSGNTGFSNTTILTVDGANTTLPGSSGVDWVRQLGVSNNDKLPSDGAYELTFEITTAPTNSGAELAIDAIVLYDNRFSYNFSQDTGDGAADSDNLPGPELYPDEYRGVVTAQDFGSTVRTMEITSASFDTLPDAVNSVWYTRNNKNVERPNWLKSSNTTDSFEYFPVDYYDNPTNHTYGSIIDIEVGFGRHGTDATKTPAEGRQGTTLQDIAFDFKSNDLQIIEGQKEFSGTYFKMLQELHNGARMRWTAEHEASQYTIHGFKDGDLQRSVGSGGADWRILSQSEDIDVEEYANVFTAQSRLRDQDPPRLTVTRPADGEPRDKEVQRLKNLGLVDSSATSSDAKVVRPERKTFPRVQEETKTKEEALSELRTEAVKGLNDHISNLEFGGDVETPPRMPLIGIQYTNLPFSNVDTATLNKVSIDLTNGGRMSATFGRVREPAQDVNRVGNEETETRESIGPSAQEATTESIDAPSSLFAVEIVRVEEV